MPPSGIATGGDARPLSEHSDAEPAARLWLVRYLSDGTPSLRDVARGYFESCSAGGARLAVNRAPRHDTESTPSLVISASGVPKERT